MGAEEIFHSVKLNSWHFFFIAYENIFIKYVSNLT